jgi:enterochelin esterase-like enzyme
VLVSAAVAALVGGCSGAGAPQEQPSAAPSDVLVGPQGRVERVPGVGSGLRGYGDYSVYLPPGYGQDPQRRYPVVYLLHGGGGSDDFFLDLGVRGAMDTAVASGAVRPMILVFVDGGPTFDGDGDAMEDFDEYFGAELVPAVDRAWRTQADRAGRAVGGISLGGRHALSIAAENPSLVAAVGGHSTTVTHLPPGTVESLAAARLPVYLDVGAGDGLFASDEALALSLRRQGADVRWNPAEGRHSPSYWSAHLLDYLRFYSEALDPGGG